MANTGLGRLILVRPRLSRPDLMFKTATRQGRGILDGSLAFDDLPSALSPYFYIIGTTARTGERRGASILPPREAAPRILSGGPRPAALLFGTEREGLSTADLRSCHLTVSIPTDRPGSSSLNLAQAVLILGYELLLSAGGQPPPVEPLVSAPFKDYQRACNDLESTLAMIGFLPRGNTGHWFMNIKKILDRALPTRGECDLIQGICRQIRWKVEDSEKRGRAMAMAEARKPQDPGPGGA
jgi:tRNA/rRNA methyltransferase